MKTNELQIGEYYEGLCAMANLNLGPVRYLGENLTSGQVRFVEIRGKIIMATLEGIIQPDLTNSSKRYDGQLEQVFISRISETALKRTEDLNKLKMEVYFAQSEYKQTKKHKG